MKKIKGYKQLIDATWVLEYSIPDDNVNKTRQEIGEPPEIIIHAYYRDDNQYQGGTVNQYWPRVTLIERDNRIVKEVTVSYTDKETKKKVFKRYRVRNRKNVFGYKRRTNNEAAH